MYHIEGCVFESNPRRKSLNQVLLRMSLRHIVLTCGLPAPAWPGFSVCILGHNSKLIQNTWNGWNTADTYNTNQSINQSINQLINQSIAAVVAYFKTFTAQWPSASSIGQLCYPSLKICLNKMCCPSLVKWGLHMNEKSSRVTKTIVEQQPSPLPLW